MITNAAKVISIALFLLLMQGCKITQIVPANGAIVSRTGDHDCATGATCVITIPGTVFADTFTGVPDVGYRFVGWKSQSGYLCGGNKTPCALENIPASYTALDANTFLEPIFEKIDLLKLLPAATRGVFQIDPKAAGAMDTSVTNTAWASGPLQILQQYSAGMDITGNAQRIVLAQLHNAPEQFLLLAKLDTSDVDTLSAAISVNATSSYRGFQRWSIIGTNLQLAKIDSLTLAIGPQAALQQALDVYSGVGAAIATGPLGTYLAGLNAGQPNNLVYGLPALYGTAPAPGSGTASLSQARVVSASFGINGDALSGGLAFYTNNAQNFRTKLLAQLAADANLPPIAKPAPAIVAYSTLASINLAGLSAEDDIRPLLKTLFLEMDAVDYTAAVVQGGNPPWLNFKVGGDPNSIFINFEFKNQTQRAAFEATHLPAGFTLAPISIIAGETPRYFLVLNIYQSSGGLVSGARAEWSVYIHDPVTGEPRFTVVQAAAASIAADSVRLLTSPEPVTHLLTPSAITSYVGVVVSNVETPYFSSSINWPQPATSNARLAREFAVANDYIFWGNGVADRGLYNSTVFNRDVVLLDNTQVTLDDDSLWKDYINPAPVHTVVYRNPLDIVVSPWWNLSANYLDVPRGVTTAHRTALINFYNGFYPGTVQGEAKKAIRGLGAVLTPVTIAASVPTARYHFTLQNPLGLLAAVDAADLTPLPVKLFEDDAAAEYYLTLSVYRREKDACGTRAEWVTYVAGPDGRPRTLRLDAFAAEVCLDPVALMTVATKMSQSVQSGSLNTQIEAPFTRFKATANLSLADGPLVGQDWIEAGDHVCSVNGICDDIYYDGQLLLAPAKRLESSNVQVQEIATPWDAYIQPGAVRLDVRNNSPAIQAINPWRNLRSFVANAPAP
jgi:hypothetical protein